jgi:truncated hemoglobin YjbI
MTKDLLSAHLRDVANAGANDRRNWQQALRDAADELDKREIQIHVLLKELEFRARAAVNGSDAQS